MKRNPIASRRRGLFRFLDSRESGAIRFSGCVPPITHRPPFGELPIAEAGKVVWVSAGPWRAERTRIANGLPGGATKSFLGGEKELSCGHRLLSENAPVEN